MSPISTSVAFSILIIDPLPFTVLLSKIISLIVILLPETLIISSLSALAFVIVPFLIMTSSLVILKTLPVLLASIVWPSKSMMTDLLTIIPVSLSTLGSNTISPGTLITSPGVALLMRSCKSLNVIFLLTVIWTVALDAV